MASPVYTQRITDWNVAGPLDQIVFRVPSVGTYVIRHLIWLAIFSASQGGLYVTDPGGLFLFHLFRTDVGSQRTEYYDLRQELRPGELIHLSLPVTQGTAAGAITAYVLS